MRYFLFTTALLFIFSNMQGQQLPRQAYDLYPTLRDMYGFAAGVYEDKVVVFGGMIKSDAPEITVKDFPNLEILLIDLGKKRASALSSANLPGLLGEQMAATGLAYYQQGHMLYVVGGYGYSDTEQRFITFPYLTAIDLEASVLALLAGQNPVAHFYQLCEERLALFNSVLQFNGQEFFLINGKYAWQLRPFEDDARYHEEDRTGEAHTFRLQGSGRHLRIEDFKSWYDVNDLRAYYGPLLPMEIEREINRTNHKRTNQ